MRRFLVLSLLVLVSAAALPATALAAPTTTAAKAATPKKWDPRLQPIADKVAKLRGLKFDHPVAAEFLSEKAFEKKVAVDKGKLSKQDKKDIEQSQAQLRAVGLIGPDVDIVDAVSSLQTSGVLAYYDPATKRVTVKGTSTDDVSIRVTLAHELTHALQDQNFDLSKLEKAAAKANAATPLRTVVEGDAVRIQDAYLATLPQADKDAYQSEEAKTSDDAQAEITAQKVPDALSVSFQAPYELGQTMLKAVIAKDKVAGVNALFRHPPTTDASYLTPSTVLDHRVFPKVAPPKLAKGEKISGKPDVFGAFTLYQVLSSRVDPAVALTAADAWGGDAMVTFTRHGTTCLRTAFRGKSRDGRQAIGTALGQWATQMPAGSTEVKTAGDTVLLTACDPGAAASEAPNRALPALVFVSNRNDLFAEFVKEGLPVAVATCTADGVVRDATFQPFLTDPSAEPDAAALSAVRARVSQIAKDCSSKSST